MSSLPSFSVLKSFKERVFDALDEIGVKMAYARTTGDKTYFFFKTNFQVEEAVDAIAHLDLSPIISGD